MSSTPTTSSTDDAELRKKAITLANCIGSPWGEGATYDPSRIDTAIELGEEPSSHLDAKDKAAFVEAVIDLIRQDREAREAAMEPTLQDVIDAGQFPTPEEYKKMIWMLRWCQNRISPPDSKAKA